MTQNVRKITDAGDGFLLEQAGIRKLIRSKQ